MNKIKRELKQFKDFKKNYKYSLKEIEEIAGINYYKNRPLKDEEGNDIGDCDIWINVGYKHKGLYGKALSNLFPYEFKFKGKKLNSIESFFQGIKFKDKKMQNLVLRYSGFNSNYIKVCTDYNWKETGIIYWQGKAIDRFSKEYEELVDELYISAIQNPLYRNVLKKCDKEIIHTLGKNDKKETVFTRFEFEKQLNCLKDFLKIK